MDLMNFQSGIPKKKGLKGRSEEENGRERKR